MGKPEQLTALMTGVRGSEVSMTNGFPTRWMRHMLFGRLLENVPIRGLQLAEVEKIALSMAAQDPLAFQLTVERLTNSRDIREMRVMPIAAGSATYVLLNELTFSDGPPAHFVTTIGNGTVLEDGRSLLRNNYLNLVHTAESFEQRLKPAAQAKYNIVKPFVLGTSLLRQKYHYFTAPFVDSEQLDLHGVIEANVNGELIHIPGINYMTAMNPDLATQNADTLQNFQFALARVNQLKGSARSAADLWNRLKNEPRAKPFLQQRDDWAIFFAVFTHATGGLVPASLPFSSGNVMGLIRNDTITRFDITGLPTTLDSLNTDDLQKSWIAWMRNKKEKTFIVNGRGSTEEHEFNLFGQMPEGDLKQIFNNSRKLLL